MTHAIERVLRRDRAILSAGLVTLTLLAWAYVIHLSSRTTDAVMNGSSGMDMPPAQMAMPNGQAWQVEDVIFTLLMWAVMMVAMMTPSATPMILAFASVNRHRYVSETPISATAAFLVGYLIVWISFSAGATFVQWGFHSAGLLSPETISVTPLLGGILLILAGVYQFTPLKYVCLSNCRTPLGFLMTEWREGTKGALIMGLRHGLYCLGCCWPLMLLLFVAGVMNLLWVALIAGYVLVEKAIPAGQWVSRAIGLLTIGWGAWLLIQVLGT
jgi:predicted metal-binding membrane protein